MVKDSLRTRLPWRSRNTVMMETRSKFPSPNATAVRRFGGKWGESICRRQRASNTTQFSSAMRVYRGHVPRLPSTSPCGPIRSKKPEKVLEVDAEAVKLLHWAAQTGDLLKVHRILGRGVPADEKVSEEGWTPLLLACHAGHLDIVSCLLQAGAVPFQQSKTGVTPLHLAAQGGYIDMVTLLCDYSEVDVNAQMSNGWTPLFFAAQNGHWAIAIYLLRTGCASVNIYDEDGRTPLYFAGQEGHDQVAKELLSCGADPEGAFEASADGATPLFIASQQGHASVVQTLINGGANVNRQKRSGATALHIAAWDGHEDVLEVLLNHGADPLVKTRGNWTCLHCAVRGGSLPIVRYLIQNCPELSSGSAGNKYLSERSSLGIGCGILASIRRRRRPNNPLIKDVASPLHIACGSGHIKIAEMLLYNEIFDIETKMPGGATPLHIAVQEGRLEMVQLLVAYGADKSQTTDSGISPMDIAIHKGQFSIVDWLEVTSNWNCLEKAAYAPTGNLLLKRLLLSEATSASQLLKCARTMQEQPAYINAGDAIRNALQLCRHGAQEWCLRNHALFPHNFRIMVLTILQVALRLSSIPDSPLYLPVEIWLTILSKCTRHA